MPTVYRELYPMGAQFGASGFPQLKRHYGTNQPVSWLAYDASAVESGFWELGAISYGGGDLTVAIVWGADSATSGTVRWEAQMIAVSPESDAVNVEAEGFGTAVTVDDAHLGTTARRLMRATLTMSGGALDGLADGDEVWFKTTRLASNAADTMSGDALLKKVLISWDSP